MVANMKITCIVHAGHVAWHLNGDVGHDLVGLARREHVLREGLKATKNSIHERRCSDDCGRLHVFVFAHESEMKNAPQIASFEVNVLS